MIKLFLDKTAAQKIKMTLSLNNFCRAFPSLQNNSTSTSFSSSASSFSDSRGGFIVRASLGTKKKKKKEKAETQNLSLLSDIR